jgi:elongation factor G
MPLGSEENFRGVIDLIEMKELDWGEDLLGSTYEIREVSEENKEVAERKRIEMLEKLSEVDDALMERYLDEVDISPEEIRRAVRKGTILLKFVPVLFGASFKNKGVHPLLDAVVDYLPSPVDIPPIVGHHPRTGKEEIRNPSDSEPFSALVFKIMNDPYVGTLSFARVYSGKTRVGSTVYNSNKDEEERITRILEMHSNKRKDVEELYAGDIAALGSMKSLSTGDTLCARNRSILLENIKFPEPVISAHIEPKSRSEHVKLADALEKLTKEDPAHPALMKYAKAGSLLFNVEEHDVARGCESLVEKLNVLIEQLNIDRLEAYGIQDADLEDIASSAGNKNNPVPLSQREIFELLRLRL